MNDLAALTLVFGQLSLVAIGGINTVLPEMQRQVVEVHGWMPAGTFAALFALAQAAPGPNMLVATLVGWRVAGMAGALVATAALVLPPAVLTYAVAHAWQRFRERPWRRTIQAGLVPLTAGLVMAAASTLCLTTATDAPAIAVTAVTTVVLLTTRLHPLWLLAAGAAVSML
jgi:chromate transporter